VFAEDATKPTLKVTSRGGSARSVLASPSARAKFPPKEARQRTSRSTPFSLASIARSISASDSASWMPPENEM